MLFCPSTQYLVVFVTKENGEIFGNIWKKSNIPKRKSRVRLNRPRHVWRHASVTSRLLRPSLSSILDVWLGSKYPSERNIWLRGVANLRNWCYSIIKEIYYGYKPCKKSEGENFCKYVFASKVYRVCVKHLRRKYSS